MLINLLAHLKFILSVSRTKAFFNININIFIKYTISDYDSTESITSKKKSTFTHEGKAHPDLSWKLKSEFPAVS